MVVHRRLHTLSAIVVQGATISGSAGLRSALANHPHSKRQDANDVHPARSRLPHATGIKRRRDVPRIKIYAPSNHHDSLPRRIARAVTIRTALAPHRTPATHRRLV